MRDLRGGGTLPPMSATAEPAPASAASGLTGARIIAAIKAAGVEYVLAVPDLHTSKGLLWPVAADPGLRLIRVCKEDECLGIAAGLAAADKRAVILIQYTGMLYAMNAIRAIACQYKQPICLMVGLLGKEADLPPRQSKKFGVRIAEPILDALGLPHHLIETDADTSVITQEIEATYAHSRAVALLIGRRPAAP
jgi:sulfopyruvate decarboxylase TPP-binding subunit